MAGIKLKASENQFQRLLIWVFVTRDARKKTESQTSNRAWVASNLQSRHIESIHKCSREFPRFKDFIIHQSDVEWNGSFDTFNYKFL